MATMMQMPAWVKQKTTRSVCRCRCQPRSMQRRCERKSWTTRCIQKQGVGLKWPSELEITPWSGLMPNACRHWYAVDSCLRFLTVRRALENAMKVWVRVACGFIEVYVKLKGVCMRVRADSRKATAREDQKRQETACLEVKWS